MAVFRTVKNKNYTVMSNYHLRDKNLSLKSKGLLSFMLSLPEDWKYSLKGLANVSKDGIYVIRNCVKELEKYGYVQRRKARNDKGQMIDVEYIIYEQPINSKKHPCLENPTSGNPTLENPTLENPILENCTQINKE